MIMCFIILLQLFTSISFCVFITFHFLSAQIYSFFGNVFNVQLDEIILWFMSFNLIVQTSRLKSSGLVCRGLLRLRFEASEIAFQCRVECRSETESLRVNRETRAGILSRPRRTHTLEYYKKQVKSKRADKKRFWRNDWNLMTRKCAKLENEEKEKCSFIKFCDQIESAKKDDLSSNLISFSVCLETLKTQICIRDERSGLRLWWEDCSRSHRSSKMKMIFIFSVPQSRSLR